MTRRLVRIVGAVAALLVAPLTGAQEILKSVQTSETAEAVQVSVALGGPVTAVKHFPMTRGRILQVQIRVEGLEKAALKRRESWSPENVGSLLKDVIYEGSVPGGPFLVFRFSRTVNFKVEGAKGAQRLTVAIEKESKAPVMASAESASDNEVDRLMRQAMQALTRGDNSGAVVLFSRVLQLPEHDRLEEAMEYLGLARERTGQLAGAKEVYERYLSAYPKGQRVATVRQRLMALNAKLARNEVPSLREVRKKESLAAASTQTYGSLAQTYFSAVNAPELASAVPTRRSLFSFMNVGSRNRSQRQETNIVFSGSNEYDFLRRNPDDPVSDFRIRNAYIDYKGFMNNLSGRVGRQKAFESGVLGRFDGTRFGYRIRQNLNVNGVVGTPVEYSSYNEVQTERPLVGVSMDFTDWVPDWKWTSYAIRQQNHGVLDRMAVGGDARFSRERNSFFGMVDYDVAYNLLNIAKARGVWQFNKATKFTADADFRRTPIMLTENALQGIPNIKPEDAAVLGISAEQLEAVKNNLTVGELRKYMSADAIRERALDNTGRYYNLRLGVNRILNEKYTVTGDVSFSDYRGKVPEIELPEVPGDEPEESFSRDVSVSARLYGKNVWLPQDFAIAGARFSATTKYNRITLNNRYRIRIKRDWNAQASVRVEYSKRKDGQQASEVELQPEAKVTYRWRRSTSFEAEAGVEINNSQEEGADYTWSYFNLGWNYSF